jgi:hypothetical protein
VKTSLLKIQVENYVRKKKEKRNPQMIRIRPFKEKEKSEGRSQLNGQWKENEKHLFTPSTFPPKNFTYTLIFSFDLNVLLYHGSRSSFTHFPLFLGL